MVNALIAVDNKSNRYYDHNLVQIEKGNCLTTLADKQ